MGPLTSCLTRAIVVCLLLCAMTGRPISVMAAEAGIAPPSSAEGEAVEGPASEPAAEPAAEKVSEPTFTIKRFIIEGSVLFPEQELQQRVREFTGRRRTAADVEAARDSLERFFHERGYPTVLVNIPEQKVESREIRLEVIENRIGSFEISGNKWFKAEKMRRDLPSLAPGEVLYLPKVQEEVNRLNRHPDFKGVPDMKPGRAPETVDINLKVTDRSPLHGSLELNNRGTHDTSDLRLSGSLRYDNLWQREHSISGQYQTSPEELSEVQVASGSYTFPSPWNFDDKLVIYGVWSNTETAVGDAFNNIGKGIIIGGRLVMPLPPAGDYNHTAVLGIDYKKFDETLDQSGADSVDSPATYAPLSINYSGALRDVWGSTQLAAGFNMAFRGMVTDSEEFADKRYRSRGNYLAMTGGIGRFQRLPGDASLEVKFDFQLASEPLISNEQYSAGGVDSVRGYRESESSGDNMVRGMVELAAPDLLKRVGRERFTLIPYLFYDAVGLWLKDPLPGQASVLDMQGAGPGIRGVLFGSIDYQVDLAYALRDTDRTDAGDYYCHFKVRYQF